MIEIRVHLIATNGFPSHNFNSQAFLGNGQSREYNTWWNLSGGVFIVNENVSSWASVHRKGAEDAMTSKK